MTLFQAFVLGIVQGITEFLPISSSGHLVLAESWFGLEVEKLLVFDVLLHAGTLVALVVFFWKDLIKMADSLWRDIKRQILKRQEPERLRDPENPREQVWYLIVATLPIVLVAPLLKDWVEATFRTPGMVVMMLGLTAIFLALAELIGKRTEPRVDSWRTAVTMGCFQLLAIIPGISRSGSTIVGGLLGGLKREAAARFAFLMAIPAIAGATLFLAKDLFEQGAEQIGPLILATGFVSSMLMSFVCMWGMLKFLRKQSLWIFVIYLIGVNLAWYGLPLLS